MSISQRDLDRRRRLCAAPANRIAERVELFQACDPAQKLLDKTRLLEELGLDHGGGSINAVPPTEHSAPAAQRDEHVRRVAKAKAYMMKHGLKIPGFSGQILKVGRSTYFVWQSQTWTDKGRVKPTTKAHIDATIDNLPDSD